MAQLVAVGGDDMGRRWALPDREVSLGRDPSCDVILVDKRVSRRHCLIRFRTDRFFIVNLSKTNGTFVNGQRTSERLLSHEDEILLGNTRLRYQEETVPMPEPTLAGSGDPSESVIFYGEQEREASGWDESIDYKLDSSVAQARRPPNLEEANNQLEAYARRFEIIRAVGDSVVTELDLDRLFELILDHVGDGCNPCTWLS